MLFQFATYCNCLATIEASNTRLYSNASADLFRFRRIGPKHATTVNISTAVVRKESAWWIAKLCMAVWRQETSGGES